MRFGRRARRRAERAAHEEAHRTAVRVTGDVQRHDLRLEVQDRQLALLTERVATLEGFRSGLQAAGKHAAPAPPPVVRDLIMGEQEGV